MATVYERLKKIIVEQLGVQDDEVVPSASFIDDLGADSLDLVELIMAMEEVLDGVRRIVYQWVNTASRIQVNISKGDTLVCVKNSRRFSIVDQVMLRNNTVYETGLIIDSIDSLDLNNITNV